MPTTLEDLEKRLAALEKEVAYLRNLLTPHPAELTPGARVARALRAARLSHPEVVAAWDKAMAEMGIPKLEPVGAEKLQEMMLAAGIKPEDNEFSREIIRQREGE